MSTEFHVRDEADLSLNALSDLNDLSAINAKDCNVKEGPSFLLETTPEEAWLKTTYMIELSKTDYT